MHNPKLLLKNLKLQILGFSNHPFQEGPDLLCLFALDKEGKGMLPILICIYYSYLALHESSLIPGVGECVVYCSKAFDFIVQERAYSPASWVYFC